VLAGQLTNPFIFRQELLFIEHVYGAPKHYFYALAGAPYLNLRPTMNMRTDLTVEDIFGPAGLPATLESLKSAILEETNWAYAFGLQHLAYESGSELYGQESLDAKMTAERDPRMAQLMMANLDNWYAYGGDLILHYKLTGPYNQYGGSGLTENVYLTTFKTAALDTVLASPQPALVAGTVPPATIAGGRFGVQSGFSAKGDFFVSFSPDTWYSYLVRIETAGLYWLSASVSAMSTGQLQALVDGDALTTWNVPNAMGQATWWRLPESGVYLERGLHAIRLRAVSGNFNVNSLSLR